MKNDRRIVVGVRDLLGVLKGISVQAVQIRLFWTRYTVNQSNDLRTNYPSKLLQSITEKTLVRNYPLSFHQVFSDKNTYIYDLCCAGGGQINREVLAEVLHHEAVSFCDKVEVLTTSTESTPDRELFFLLRGRQMVDYPQTILPQNTPYDVIDPEECSLPITVELLENYYTLLERHWEAFYTDVHDRYCTVWCATENRGEYTVRRNLWGQKIMFPPSFAESHPMLQINRMVQIVPNTLPESLNHPIEIVIDLDIPPELPYTTIKQVTDRFCEWLIEQGLWFLRRATGSSKAGQHIIVPCQWTDPVLLCGKTEVWSVYTLRPYRHILSDSSRDVCELLCLLFQTQNPTIAQYMTTRIFNPFSRHKRILFDVFSCSMNRGRRALLSLHHNSLNVCVPLTTDLPATHEEFLDLVALDLLLEQDTLIAEPRVSRAIQESNTRILQDMADRYNHMYQDFYSLTAAQFDEQYGNIPIDRKELREE
jgi:hypothetical protein